MKNKILSLSASLLLLASVSTTHVVAEPIKIGAAEISFNAGYMSNYQWRGEDQNSGDGTPMAGMDVSLPLNIYVGTWTASADWANGQEVDFYGGIAPSFGDISFDLGYISYYYQGGDDGTNFGEFYIGASYAPEDKPYSFGLKYAESDTKGGDNTAANGSYSEVSASYDFISLTYGDYEKSREYYTVAVTKEYSGIEFSLAYTDADWDAGKSAATNQKDEFLVLSLSKSF